MPLKNSSTSSAGSNPAGLTLSRSSFLIRDRIARRLSTPDKAGRSLESEGYADSSALKGTGDSRSIVHSLMFKARSSVDALTLSLNAGESLSALLITFSHEP